MPIHDWTRTHAESTHSHHVSWMAALSGMLNTGGLPTPYYAMIQSHHARNPLIHAEPSKGRQRTLGIYHEGGHRIVAVVEQTTRVMVSRRAELADFLRRVGKRIRLGIHTLIVDIHAPTEEYASESFDQYAARVVTEGDGDLAVSSFDATTDVALHRVRFGVGDDIPAVPLRLAPDVSVILPQQAAYDAGFAGSPPYLRELLSAPAA